MSESATTKVKNVPTVPINRTVTIQEGSLYLSLLKPSIWNGRHTNAAIAAIRLESVVNIRSVPNPASGVVSL